MTLKGYQVDGDYLGEIALIESPVNKLVYLFIVIFRKCELDDIIEGLGLEAWQVVGAVNHLEEIGVIERKRRNGYVLPKSVVLPLERYQDDGKPRPAWFTPPDE